MQAVRGRYDDVFTYRVKENSTFLVLYRSRVRGQTQKYVRFPSQYSLVCLSLYSQLTVVLETPKSMFICVAASCVIAVDQSILFESLPPYTEWRNKIKYGILVHRNKRKTQKLL